MIISIDGNISSGKSTVVQRLAADHRVFPEPLDKWTFLDKFYADPRAYALPFSLQILTSFAEYEFTDDASETDIQDITERSPLTNREVFTKIHVNDGTMTDADWDTYKRYFDIIGWKPDAIVYVHVPVDVCQRRMIKRNRACEENVSIEYLERIEKSYDTLLRFANIPYEIVDGTNDPDVVERDVRAALRRLRSPTAL